MLRRLGVLPQIRRSFSSGFRLSAAGVYPVPAVYRYLSDGTPHKRSTRSGWLTARTYRHLCAGDAAAEPRCPVWAVAILELRPTPIPTGDSAPTGGRSTVAGHLPAGHTTGGRVVVGELLSRIDVVPRPERVGVHIPEAGVAAVVAVVNSPARREDQVEIVVDDDRVDVGAGWIGARLRQTPLQLVPGDQGPPSCRTTVPAMRRSVAKSPNPAIGERRTATAGWVQQSGGGIGTGICALLPPGEDACAWPRASRVSQDRATIATSEFPILPTARAAATP